MNIRKCHRLNKGKIVILGLGTTLALGNATQAKFDGFYAGASMGYLTQNTDIKANQNPKNPNAHVNNTRSQRGSPTIEFFFGWGKVFQSCFYGGLEGKIDFVKGGAKKIAEDTNFIYRAGRRGLGIALLARLGYLVTPHTLIYGGVGVKKIQFKYNFFEKLDKVSAPFSKRSMHLLTEIGVETLLTTSKNLAFRASYSFTPKRSLTQNTTNFPINHVYREHGVFRAKTTEHILKAGLIYQF
jgi:hypothetical protein